MPNCDVYESLTIRLTFVKDMALCFCTGTMKARIKADILEAKEYA